MNDETGTPFPHDAEVLRRGERRMFWSLVVAALVVVAPIVGFFTLGFEGGAFGGGVSIVILTLALAQYANAGGHGQRGPRDDKNARF